MNKWTEILLGMIFIIVPIVIAFYSAEWWGTFWNFKHAAWEFLKGGVFWVVVMVGLLFVLLGLSDLKG